MGMDIGAKGSLKADINVTPLVDVMLVLLIIMMLVAPMLQKGVDVKLPQASNSSDKPRPRTRSWWPIAADRRLFLNSVPVAMTTCARRSPRPSRARRKRSF